MDGGTDTKGYADRLSAGWRWKSRLGLQLPYRWHLRRLALGFTLDVGCGIGRNLAHLNGNGVGVDHNPHSVALARTRGLVTFTPSEFLASPYAVPGRFDSLLLAHVVEHMHFAEAVTLVGEYLRYVVDGGKIVLVAPQEAGFRRDPTHVEFMDAARLTELLYRHGVAAEFAYSFPFPRAVGRVFPHNEFVVIGRKTQA